jgi:hypothetical protein
MKIYFQEKKCTNSLRQSTLLLLPVEVKKAFLTATNLNEMMMMKMKENVLVAVDDSKSAPRYSP